MAPFRVCIDCKTETTQKRTCLTCDTCLVACCTQCVVINIGKRYICAWCVRNEERPMSLLKKEDFMATRSVSLTLEVVDSPEMTDSKVMEIMSAALQHACKQSSIINGTYSTGSVSEYFESEDEDCMNGIYCG